MPGAYLLQADARAIPLRSGSVQCVVTSPPYWGLRDYGLPPSVWGGEPEHAHEWGEYAGRTFEQGNKRAPTDPGVWDGRPRSGDANKHEPVKASASGAFCPCGSWRGVLGLEPTPELYVAHLVEVFREVRRVLRDDGTCWLNLGDSYATGAGKVGDRPGGVALGAAWSARGGLKPKDLVGIPWRVAFALQADEHIAVELARRAKP